MRSALSRDSREARVYVNRLGRANQFARALWGITYALLFRPSPRPFHAWRRMILRLFGARVDRGAHPYPTCRIWAPWNLVMGAHSSLADRSDCYSVARVVLDERVTVSQDSFLCTATHDCDHPEFPLVTAPIRLCAQSWVAADAFIGPGVTVGTGAVVGARSSVFRDVAPWTIVGGNPARYLRERRH